MTLAILDAIAVTFLSGVVNTPKLPGLLYTHTTVLPAPSVVRLLGNANLPADFSGGSSLVYVVSFTRGGG